MVSKQLENKDKTPNLPRSQGPRRLGYPSVNPGIWTARPGSVPRLQLPKTHARLRQGVSRTGAYTCLTQGLLARTLRTHARPHARSPRSTHALLTHTRRHARTHALPALRTPSSAQARSPRPRPHPDGSQTVSSEQLAIFPVRLGTDTEGFHGLHATRVHLYRPSPTCPPTSVQLCHIPMSSLSVSMNCIMLPTWEGSGHIHAGPAALPPKAPGSGVCLGPSCPPLLSSKHSQMETTEFFPLCYLCSEIKKFVYIWLTS